MFFALAQTQAAANDRTTLMLAAQNGRQDIVEMLHSGADPHLRDKNGSRPLYMQKTRDMPALAASLRRAEPPQ